MTIASAPVNTGPLKRDGGQRQRAYVTIRATPGMTIAERIRLHTKIDPHTECWEWQLAPIKDTGYGCLAVNSRRHLAHRASYETFVGPIPDGLHIDHLCRNRICVNPAHLEPVTVLENVRRSPIAHGSETACPRGHAYDDANTYRVAGRRYCRTCHSAYKGIYSALTPEERAARKAAGLPVVDLDTYFAEQSEERAA